MKLTLNIQIMLGALGGVAVGLLIAKFGPQSSAGHSIVYLSSLIAKIFISLLKMILIPLVFVSITVGIANLRAHAQMDKVWKVTVIYFVTTSFLAIFLGLLAMNIFKPGVGLEMGMFKDHVARYELKTVGVQEFTENFLSNLFVNPFAAMAQGDVLSTIIFAIFLGIALVAIGEKSKNVLRILNESFDLIMLIVNWIMKLLPIGIFCLLIKLIATSNTSLFPVLTKYIAVVVGATLFHGFITLPLIMIIFAKTKISTYYKGVNEVLITALSTSSSNATLPVTYRCMTENLKVDRDIAGFVLPLGATVNMDGTALYEAVAALFIANLVGVDLNIVQQLIVALMAMLASIGAPGIPSAGMVTMVMVLQSVGLPAEAIGILIPLDRPLDSIRTMVNVKGDTIGCLVVQRFVSTSGVRAEKYKHT